jgi:hypothetical protein
MGLIKGGIDLVGNTAVTRGIDDRPVEGENGIGLAPEQ